MGHIKLHIGYELVGSVRVQEARNNFTFLESDTIIHIHTDAGWHVLSQI